MMEVERESDGHWHFKLGPIERWIVVLVGAGVIGLSAYTVDGFKDQLTAQVAATTEQGKTLQKVETQQAGTSGQLVTLSAQLAGVPGLTREVARLRVEMDATKQDVRELRQTRGLR